MRVANHRAVINRDLAVMVGVHPNDITGTCAIELRPRIVGDLLFVLEYSGGLVAVEETDRAAYLRAVHLVGGIAQHIGLTMNNAFRVGYPCHLILIIGKVEGRPISEVAHFVIPRKGDLHTLVLHVAAVDERSARARCGKDGSLNKPVFCLLDIIVERQTQPTVEEAGIETEVGLL